MRRIGIGTCAILGLATLVSACGGGGDSGTVTSTGGGGIGDGLSEVSTTHANGSLATIGMVDEDGRKQGTWKAYWSDGSLLFEGAYVDDQLDHSQHWVEQNKDGSVRFAQDDGPHPDGGPLGD